MRKLANPAPLGLLGFGMTTILLNFHNAGFYPLDSMILAMGIVYGGFAQILVGIMEFQKGNTFGTVAFTSYGLDGDSSGVHLFKEVDAAFNNYSDESAGVLQIPGYDEKICPLSGITGNVIHWMLMAAWTDHMARRGEMPYYYQGFHERDGQAYDKLAEPLYLERGY